VWVLFRLWEGWVFTHNSVVTDKSGHALTCQEVCHHLAVCAPGTCGRWRSTETGPSHSTQWVGTARGAGLTADNATTPKRGETLIKAQSVDRIAANNTKSSQLVFGGASPTPQGNGVIVPYLKWVLMRKVWKMEKIEPRLRRG